MTPVFRPKAWLPLAQATRVLGFGAAIALLAGGPALAQYKWKDQNGQLHVSDRPPPADVPERNILKRPAAPVRASPPASAASAASAADPGQRGAMAGKGTGDAASTASKTDPELERRRVLAEQKAKQVADQQAQAEERQLAAQRAVQCQRANQQLALYQSGQRMATVNAAGERVVVDDAARAAEMQLARRLMAENCR